MQEAEKGRDSRPLYVIYCEIDDSKWTVLRKESELVRVLHALLPL